jgi:hypothetical protein
MELATDNVGEALHIINYHLWSMVFLGDEYPTLELVSYYSNANISQWHV